MKSDRKQALAFIGTVTLFHVVTYFIMGFVASSVLGYKELFDLPVIREYYRTFGSVSNLLGPFIQIARGLVFGLVLLPFRKVLADSRFGWAYLWFLFLGFGIIGTPAAAPSSIEGLVYTKLPLWFHFLGLPEITIQTLIFSLLVHNKFSSYKLVSSFRARVLLQALSTACFSFIGYTIVSILFAVLAGASVTEGGADPKVLGQFIMPLLLTFITVLASVDTWWLPKHVVLYLTSFASLILYQSLLLGGGNWVYAFVAPVLPVMISLFLTRPKKPVSS